MSLRASSRFIGKLLGFAVGAAAAAAVNSAAAATPEAPTASSVSTLIQQAERTRLVAAERGTEWLKTSELIQDARQAAADGRLDQAAQLAQEALTLGELAIEQADREAEAWRNRVPR